MQDPTSFGAPHTSSMVAARKPAGIPNASWWMLIYHVPAQPSNNRVSVWRELKRIGVLYLQQAVCVVPRTPGVEKELASVRERITNLGGSSSLLALPKQARAEQAALVGAFHRLVADEYAKIVEETEKSVLGEIGYERARKRFTFTEAQEIEANLEKGRRWFDRTRARDWFTTPGATAVESMLKRCERALSAYYAEVHARGGGEPSASGRDKRRPKKP